MSQARSPYLGAIQELVDDIAERLGRSVEVATPSISVICASAQLGPIDQHRAESILTRTPPRGPLPWLLGFGILEATEPVRVPANEEYDLLPRLVCPLWVGSRLYGHLWVIDDPVVTPEEEAILSPYLLRLADLVHDHDSFRDRRALAEEILADVPGALDRARADGDLPTGRPLVIHSLLCAEEGVLLRRLETALNRSSVQGSLALAVGDRSLVLIGGSLREMEALASVYGIHPVARGSAAVDPAGGVNSALIRARFLADVAQLLGVDHMDWDSAGAWRVLLGWELSDATVRALVPELQTLLATGVGEKFWRTLLAYLDNARNTNTTAAQLYIHRATLHYRLERVREILGPDVTEDGWRATMLHIGLRLHAALEAAR